MPQTLSVEKEMEVRFNEVDSYNIVWNGCYPAYFEAGRQEFGRKFELGIDTLLAEGIYAPLTRMEINYRKPLRFNNRILVRTSFVNSTLAMLIFTYEIMNLDTGELACTGKSEQAFLNKDWQLIFFIPPILQRWKDQWLSVAE